MYASFLPLDRSFKRSWNTTKKDLGDRVRSNLLTCGAACLNNVGERYLPAVLVSKCVFHVNCLLFYMYTSFSQCLSYRKPQVEHFRAGAWGQRDMMPDGRVCKPATHHGPGPSNSKSSEASSFLLSSCMYAIPLMSQQLSSSGNITASILLRIHI